MAPIVNLASDLLDLATHLAIHPSVAAVTVATASAVAASVVATFKQLDLVFSSQVASPSLALPTEFSLDPPAVAGTAAYRTRLNC